MAISVRDGAGSWRMRSAVGNSAETFCLAGGAGGITRNAAITTDSLRSGRRTFSASRANRVRGTCAAAIESQRHALTAAVVLQRTGLFPREFPRPRQARRAVEAGSAAD